MNIRRHKKTNKNKISIRPYSKNRRNKKSTRERKYIINWIPNMKNQVVVPTAKRQSTLQVATDFYKDLHHEVRAADNIITQKDNKSAVGDMITSELLRKLIH